MDRMRQIERKASQPGGITWDERSEWHRLHVRPRFEVYSITDGKVLAYDPPQYIDYGASIKYLDSTTYRRP